MSLLRGLRELLSPGPKVAVHIVIRGRIGPGWLDVDERLRVPEGTTLGGLLDIADARGIPLRDAIDKSPHLKHTLMLNGERCPVADNLGRTIADGDELYLLAPLAGG